MPSSRGSDAGEQVASHAGDNDAARHAAGENHEPAAQAEAAVAEAENDREDPAGELAQIEDRYRRALADLDNYRKRSLRELDRRVDEATEVVLRDWLDVVDSVERAIQMEVDAPCREGLQAVMAQIDAVLQRHGTQRIGMQGDRFDPQRHEAVATRASRDVPHQTVLDVQRSGFARGERVIRPAQVVVARTGEHAH